MNTSYLLQYIIFYYPFYVKMKLPFFFFLISKNYAIQQYKNSRTDVNENKPDAAIQSTRVWRTIHLISNSFHSFPSKHLAFLSHQIHQNKQLGIALQSSTFLDLPRPRRQQANNSITPWGITHWTPNRLKKKFHNSLASGQCRSKWAMDSPLLFHIQHQSTTNTRLLSLFFFFDK